MVKDFKPFYQNLLSEEIFESIEIMGLYDLFNVSSNLGFGTNKKTGNGIDKLQNYIYEWMMNNEEEVVTKP